MILNFVSADYKLILSAASLLAMTKSIYYREILRILFLKILVDLTGYP